MKTITKFDNLNIKGIHFVKDSEDKDTFRIKLVFESDDGELKQVLMNFNKSEALQYLKIQAACLTIHKFTGNKATEVAED